ncbi:MAG: OmpH family outer membrane protein [Methylococcales bacterium]|jgi:outer membrane protein|nr:OmpH family outer membrane protein [Methylococcales bacterium]MBT7409297.1 OmpH family outer membrane protein [Methylococcales bacterium]
MFKTKSSFLFLLGLLVCLTGQVFADTKIGYVNAAKILEKVPHSDAARRILAKEFAPRDKKLVVMQKAQKKLEAKFTREAATMSAAGLKKLERAIRDKKREIKRAQDEFREDFNIRRNEELVKLQKAVVESIRQLGKDEKYDLILNDAGVVYYNKDTVDITNKVIEKLKSEFASQNKK